MIINFRQCDVCGRPLHKKICDMCRTSVSAVLSRGTYDNQTLSRIADMIWDSLEQGIKLTLYLTRARYD